MEKGASPWRNQMLTMISKLFRGAPPPESVEPQTQSVLSGLFDQTLRERERRRRSTIPDPFTGRTHDLSETYNPLDVKLR
jgi:hypothetical protein